MGRIFIGGIFIGGNFLGGNFPDTLINIEGKSEESKIAKKRPLSQNA